MNAEERDERQIALVLVRFNYVASRILKLLSARVAMFGLFPSKANAERGRDVYH